MSGDVKPKIGAHADFVGSEYPIHVVVHSQMMDINVSPSLEFTPSLHSNSHEIGGDANSELIGKSGMSIVFGSLHAESVRF